MKLRFTGLVVYVVARKRLQTSSKRCSTVSRSPVPKKHLTFHCHNHNLKLTPKSPNVAKNVALMHQKNSLEKNLDLPRWGLLPPTNIFAIQAKIILSSFIRKKMFKPISTRCSDFFRKRLLKSRSLWFKLRIFKNEIQKF